MFCTDLYANCRTYILYLPHLRIILEILENQCRHLTHFTWVQRKRFSKYKIPIVILKLYQLNRDLFLEKFLAY